MGHSILRISALVASACALPGQVAVLTANYDTDRTNANLQESILNTENVTADRFGKLGSWAVDGQIYAQPLYLNGVVYVATMRNSVYAFDAAAGPGSDPLWHVSLGAPVPSTYLQFRDVNPEVGILSTPVIDPAQNAIYLVTDTFENGKAVFRLHALDLATGAGKLGGPVEIKAEVAGDGDASQGGRIAFDPSQHLQRPGLLLANGNIYLGFGSHADATPYHGWLMAYDASNLQRQVAVLNTTPQGSGGSIWQSGRGLAADEGGNILAGSANGDYDGVFNFGETYLKLAPDLTLLDWYAPAEWQMLNDGDFDLGSLGPVRLAGSGLMLGGDKAGNLYLIDENNMGRLADDGNSPARVFQPISYGGIFDVALWNSPDGPIVYVAEQGDATRAFRIVDGQFESGPFSETGVSPDIPFQGMAVSVNGGEPGTAILWMTTGDHQTAGVPGTLHAFDALDLTRELWSSDWNAGRDSPGRFAKFVAPTVADGRVYVPTFSGQLAVYGLLPVSD